MNATTSREHRQKALKDIREDMFANQSDYYFFIHINNNVRFVHAISFLIALLIFILSIIERDLKLFILQYFVSTFSAILSHFIFDGIIPKGPVQTPVQSLRLGIRHNIKFITGKLSIEEVSFIKKYPLVNKVFRQNTDNY